MDKVRSKDRTLIATSVVGPDLLLVLVHGTTADHTRWASVIPMLEQKFTVVGSIQGPLNLLGHSYGALCSLEAALRVANLNRLILYELAISIGVTSREFANEDYILDPLRFRNLNVPTMLLQGAESPDFLKAATEAVHACL